MNKMNFTNDLSRDVFNYLINDKSLIDEILAVFKIEGTVVFEFAGTKKNYGFIGNGCGITYLTYDGRSRKAKEFDELVFEIKRKVHDYIYENHFTEEQYKYFENFGCPVMAVLQQDQQIQIAIYSRLVKYAKEVLGIKKIGYRSILD